MAGVLKSLEEEIRERTQTPGPKFARGFNRSEELREKLAKSRAKLQSFENLFAFFRDFEEQAMDLVTSKYLRPDLRVIEKEIKNFKHEHFSKLLKSPQVFTTQILTSFENLISVELT